MMAIRRRSVDTNPGSPRSPRLWQSRTMAACTLPSETPVSTPRRRTSCKTVCRRSPGGDAGLLDPLPLRLSGAGLATMTSDQTCGDEPGARVIPTAGVIHPWGIGFIVEGPRGPDGASLTI